MSGDAPGRGLFVPVLLVALSVVAMMGAQTFQLLQQRSNLETARKNQDSALAESQRVRTQLQSIGQGTADLALQGNKNAQFIVGRRIRHRHAFWHPQVPGRVFDNVLNGAVRVAGVQVRLAG